MLSFGGRGANETGLANEPKRFCPNCFDGTLPRESLLDRGETNGGGVGGGGGGGGVRGGNRIGNGPSTASEST